MFLQKLKKRVLVVLLVCLMFTVTLVFKLGPGPGTGMSEYNMGNEVIKTLIWTSPNNPPNLGTLTRLRKLVSHLNAENGEHCKLTNMDQHLQCEFSTRADAVEGVDAVAVYMPNADEFTESDLPKIRKSHQLWISFLTEPPGNSNWKDEFLEVFNWTMSYRRDSDIWAPYGRKILLPTSKHNYRKIMIGDIALDKLIAKKSKLSVTIPSTCNTTSQREKLIQKKVGSCLDVLGPCGSGNASGPIPCNSKSNGTRDREHCNKFWRKLAGKYKFFLAFEDSLCKDYITEQFWQALEFGMVPVVYGGASYSRIAPPQSYITVKDYESLKELMKFLRKTGKDKNEYAKYFDWRRNYIVERAWSRPLCDLCKMIANHKSGKWKIDRTYENLRDWWHFQPGGENKSWCEAPHQFLSIDLET